MVGGTEADYQAVKGLLECMGKKITHCGDYGMGQAAKICNNMLLGIEMIGVCEAMNLAIRFVESIFFRDVFCFLSEAFLPPLDSA